MAYTEPEPWWIRAGKCGGGGYGLAIYDAANSGRDDAVVLVALLIVLLLWWIFEVVRWRKEHRV